MAAKISCIVASSKSINKPQPYLPLNVHTSWTLLPLTPYTFSSEPSFFRESHQTSYMFSSLIHHWTFCHPVNKPTVLRILDGLSDQSDMVSCLHLPPELSPEQPSVLNTCSCYKSLSPGFSGWSFSVFLTMFLLKTRGNTLFSLEGFFFPQRLPFHWLLALEFTPTIHIYKYPAATFTWM